MSQDVDDDFILFVVLISCIIASHLFYTNVSYLNYSLHYVLDGLFPATYNSKKGGGGSSGPVRDTDYTCSVELTSDIVQISIKRYEYALDSSDQLRLVVRGIVRLYLLVGQRDPFSRGLLVVDDHVLDILTRMDSKVLIASPFQGRHVLGIL